MPYKALARLAAPGQAIDDRPSPTKRSAAPVTSSLVPPTNRAGIALLPGAPDRGMLPTPPSAVPLDTVNEYAIVNELRRAIDSSDVYLVGMDTIYSVSAEPKVRRHVDGAKVIAALEGLTVTEAAVVGEAYQSQLGRSLERDLFGLGASGVHSDLTDDEMLRIMGLLGGSHADHGPPPSGRFLADAAELHQLLAGDLDQAERERIMTLLRRVMIDQGRLDAAYHGQYGEDLGAKLLGRLEGLQRSRMEALRAGDPVRADACAIQDRLRIVAEKRRQLADLDREYAEVTSTLLGGLVTAIDPTVDLRYQTMRKELLSDIGNLVGDVQQVVAATTTEAMTETAGITSAEAVSTRLRALLAVQSSFGSGTLADDLRRTVGGAAGSAITAAASGDLPRSAAYRLAQLEADHRTNTSRVSPLLRGLRSQAVHDVRAAMFDPITSQDAKARIAADPRAAVDALARDYVQEFLATYEAVRGVGRPWAEIVSSADSENEIKLNALVSGGGELSELAELEYALAKPDRELVVTVLHRQPTGMAVDRLEAAYDAAHGGTGVLRRRLFGVSAELARTGFTLGRVGMLTGRNAARASESLARPAKRGGLEEVQWLATWGAREVSATEATQGFVGELREWGDDPETQDLMNESVRRLLGLATAWATAAPEARREILADMREVRVAITGDTAAYEAENATIVAQLRSALSLVVQVGLAFALPGLGAGFLASTALGIAATVGSNMAIYGEEYDLTHLRDDVVGGLLGGFGGKLGEELAGVVAVKFVGRSARAAGDTADRVGVRVSLSGEVRGAALTAEQNARLAVAVAKFSGNVIGGTAGSSIATGTNEFTPTALARQILMGFVGKAGDLHWARVRAGRSGTSGGPGGSETSPLSPDMIIEPIRHDSATGRSSQLVLHVPSGQYLRASFDPVTGVGTIVDVTTGETIASARTSETQPSGTQPSATQPPWHPPMLPLGGAGDGTTGWEGIDATETGGFRAEGPLVSGPVGAVMLDVGSGPTPADLGVGDVVQIIRTDLVETFPIDRVLNAEQAIADDLVGSVDTVVINNPYGYLPDLNALGQAVRPGGKIIIQGHLKANKYFRRTVQGPPPTGFVVRSDEGFSAQVDLEPAVSDAARPDAVRRQMMGGPFSYRSGEGSGPQPDTRVVYERLPEAPEALGKRLGELSKGQQSRFDYVAKALNGVQLEQTPAADAAEAATREMGLRLWRTSRDGNVLLCSVMPGQHRPILVISDDGVVLRAVADLTVRRPIDPNEPLEISNIVTDPPLLPGS